MAVGFAERRGYRRGRQALFLRLELATATLPDLPVPAGVTLASAAELADPRPLYEADLAASRRRARVTWAWATSAVPTGWPPTGTAPTWTRR